MKCHSLRAVALCFALAAPARAAAPDVADMFPPGTLAYAELHNPAELAPQFTAVFKGTPLEDSTSLIHTKKDAAKTLVEMKAQQELAQLALLLSPEMLNEFRKFGGLAIGLVGYSARGEPEVAFAVLTGDSAAAAIAARAFVTMSPTLRKVGEVSKVPVFQHRNVPLVFDPNTGTQKFANEKPPAEAPYELTFAYTPGLFVAGTSKNALAPIIKRFLGEEKDRIRDTDNFKTAATAYRKPGLFFYVNVPEFIAKTDAANRVRGDMLDFDLYAWLKVAANQGAMKFLAGSVQFRDNGLSLAVSGRFDHTRNSALLDFFTGPAVRVDGLHHARKPASFAATVNVGNKNRAAAFIGLLDMMAKGNGELGRLPGDVVKDLDAKYKLKVTESLLAKVRTITVIVPTKQELPKGAKPIPMFVLHAEDAAAAVALEEFLPKLIAELAGESAPAQPSTETFLGVKVYSLPATGLPWKAAIHYARKDAVLAVGLDRVHVATALNSDAAKCVIGDKPLPLPPGDRALIGALNIGDLIAAHYAKGTAALGPVRPVDRDPLPPVPNLNRLAALDSTHDLDKARIAFLAAFTELPLTVVTVVRNGDELRIELFQPQVQGGGFKPVINAGVNWFEKLMILRDPNRPHVQFGGGAFPEFPR